MVSALGSAALGFAFSFAIGRGFGTTGSGVVLQTVAVFTIVLSATKVGLDTTALWLLPRLRSSAPDQLRPALMALLVPATAVSGLLVGVWLALLEAGVHILEPSVEQALTMTVWFLPPATFMTVALAATRAFGGVVPFNLINNLGVPVLRLIAVLGILVAGGSAIAGAVGWALPWAIGAAASALVLIRQVRRVDGSRGSRWPDSGLRRTVVRYSAPRAVAGVIEQSMVWLSVILVGGLLGSSDAGVYGLAARFVAAGVIVSAALRIVIAPRFSALLGQDEIAATRQLYSITSRWILLFGSPGYVILAVYAPTVLGWLGAGFSAGESVMVILCLGAIVRLAAGNVQSLLLMSGGSARQAVNKLIALVVLVVGTMLLVPTMGINGAAWAWAAAITVDTLLAVTSVRRGSGITVDLRGTVAVALFVGVCVGGLALLFRLGLGQNELGLAASVAAGAVAVLLGTYLARGPLHGGELAGIFRRAGS